MLMPKRVKYRKQMRGRMHGEVNELVLRGEHMQMTESRERGSAGEERLAGQHRSKAEIRTEVQLDRERMRVDEENVMVLAKRPLVFDAIGCCVAERLKSIDQAGAYTAGVAGDGQG